jgi:type II secretory pathway pseudopilin PulG
MTHIASQKVDRSESGFTLIETAISMVLLAIIGLGIVSLFAYAASSTSNAADREMASAVAQQRMEQLRTASFTDTALNATSAEGASVEVMRLGRRYRVVTLIANSSIVNSQVASKTITVKVIPLAASSEWSNTTSLFGSVTLISERSSQTTGPNRLW